MKEIVDIEKYSRIVSTFCGLKGIQMLVMCDN